MFYVCEKKGNKYGVADTDDGICEFFTKSQLLELKTQGVQIVGVSQTDISIVDSKFLLAKSKLLNIELVNTDYLKTYEEYLISSGCTDVHLISTNSSILVKDWFKHSGYIFNSLRIPNLWNNKYYNSSFYKDTIVYYNFSMELLYHVVISISQQIKMRGNVSVNGNITSIYRVDRNSIIVAYESYDSIGLNNYYCVGLESGVFRRINLPKNAKYICDLSDALYK